MRFHPIARVLFLAIVTVATLLPLPGSQGTAHAIGLELSVPLPATFGAGLGTSGTVDSTGGSVVVTSLGSWFLRVRGTDNGRLRGTGTGMCTQGSTLLTNPLGVFASGSGVNNRGYTSGNPLTLSGSSQLLASGTNLVATVGLTYRYTPSPSDQLPAACPYSQTTTIDVSAS